MSLIKQVKFLKNTVNEIKELTYGENWPVVYLLENQKEMYIGESSNVFERVKTHLRDGDKKKLKNLHIIYDERFNKSAILDIEALLIQYIGADNVYKLKNRNNGQSQSHDYYQRQMYLDSFDMIWRKLQNRSLVKQSIDELRNLDLFKYSPYKTLTTDQYNTSQDILFDLLSNVNKEGFPSIISGGAGTGKTVLAIYLMKLLSDSIHKKYNMDDIDDEDGVYMLLANLRNLPKFEFALVVPVVPLRKTLKTVFKETPGLRANMVIGPSEVSKKNYDLLIVDEAHRLKRRVNLSSYDSFDKMNEQLNFGVEGTELDWIMKSSKFQIFFYDGLQSIKPTDIRKEKFDELKKNKHIHFYNLDSQMRVLGGNDYIEYIRSILNSNPPIKKKKFETYDLNFFDHIEDIMKEIKVKDSAYGLCRNVAGYSWKWNNKGNAYDDIMKNNGQDIVIEGHKYIWNTKSDNWVHSDHSVDEIGCIHTIQGFDLNYTGVIFGKEITYNEESNQIEIIEENYHDINGKRAIQSSEELKEYIINIYYVLMTRGIRGTYVYVCDEKLRKYLRTFI